MAIKPIYLLFGVAGAGVAYAIYKSRKHADVGGAAGPTSVQPAPEAAQTPAPQQVMMQTAPVPQAQTATFVPVDTSGPPSSAPSAPILRVGPSIRPAATFRAPLIVNAIGKLGTGYTVWQKPTTFKITPALISRLGTLVTQAAPSTSTSTSPSPAAPLAPLGTTTSAPPSTPKVLVYGTETCPHTKASRVYMQNAGIAYTFRNVADQAVNAEMWNKLGPLANGSSTAIPVIDVNGDILVGWNQGDFNKLYANAAATNG